MKTVYHILYPEYRTVTAEQLIGMARDDYANNEGFDGEMEYPNTVEQALAILKETGTVTLGRIPL